MTNNNLYYYQKSYPSYTKEEAVQIITKFIVRKLEKLFKVAAIVLLVIAAIALYRGEQVLKFAEEQLQIYSENHPYIEQFAERLSIEQMVWNYIDSLPLPQIEVEQKVEEGAYNQEETHYDQTDVELLARLMYAEEGIFIYRLPENEAKYVNQLAGSVVLHRRNMNYRGAKTIEEVIYDEGQYACVENGSIDQEVPEIVYEWAEELLKYGPIGPENMIFQAEFEQGTEVFDQVGNQYFCIK